MAFITFYDCTETDKQQLNDALSETDHYWEFVDEPISTDNLKADSEVISVFVTSTVTPAIIEKLPKLRLVSCRSTGYNNIDISACQAKDITVTNVPTYGEHTVAEYAFTLILHLSRKIGPTVAAVNDRHLKNPLLLRGFDLYEKTLGIVGMGKIGSQLAKIANGFGMPVIAYDPYPKDELAKEYNFRYTGMEELLSSSDVVSLHAPYTTENHHLLNTKTLSIMKPTVILINTARGELIDTASLVDALEDKKLAGAALDVLEGEKLLDIDEELQLLRGNFTSSVLELDAEIKLLAEMPNVIITPHNAYNTAEAIQRINATAVQNIIRYWYGETPNKVTAPSHQPGKLIIIRHGESEWNAEGKWTGSRDVHLTEKGFHEAALLGQAVADIPIGFAYTSQQIRALETLEGVLDASQEFDVPFERSDALNERDYGDYTGKNKWEVRDSIGQEAFERLRRDWDYPVPNGETLKAVYERVVPFYEQAILPKIRSGQNVLVVSHGNAIRALIKHLENISDDGISKIEMPFGNVLIYDLDEYGLMKYKHERLIDTTPPPA